MYHLCILKLITLSLVFKVGLLKKGRSKDDILLFSLTFRLCSKVPKLVTPIDGPRKDMTFLEP